VITPPRDGLAARWRAGFTNTSAALAKDRRGAVGILFGLSLVPLILLIALTIDFSFFVEARSQIQLAADASATHAIRAATGTYALETTQGVGNTTASSDAIAAGECAGENWFQAQLGQLPTAYVPNQTPCPASGTTNPTVVVNATTDPSGFTASVNYDGIYPPIFNPLFHDSQNWNIAGTSGAAAQYSYVEILMLLDTSNSMLLGATPSDIYKMDINTVCIPAAAVTNSSTGALSISSNSSPRWGGDSALIDTRHAGIGNNNNENYDPSPTGSNAIPFATAGAIPRYTPGGGDGTTGSCNPSGRLNTFDPTDWPGNNGYATTPCALACHTTTGTSSLTGKSADLYGYDRYLGVTLRLDLVLQATEQVITSMIDAEQATQQFSVGIYQFNNDVSVLVPNGAVIGTQGAPWDQAHDLNYEASYDLPGVLQAVQGIDYSYKPETSFPPVNAVDDGNTNFPTSLKDFNNGNATNNIPLQAVTQATEGYTASNPAKDIFIVTDGMEDECGSSCNSTRVIGEMTGVAAENGTSQLNPAVCKLLKNKGFTVYVLYIDYYPPPILTYYTQYSVSHVYSIDAASDAYTNEDFPGIANGSAQQDAEATTMTGINNPPPNEQGLQACASSTADFYEATDSTQIATDMSAMLKSALSSATRLTE